LVTTSGEMSEADKVQSKSPLNNLEELSKEKNSPVSLSH